MKRRDSHAGRNRAPKLLAFASLLLLGAAAAPACGVSDVSTTKTPPSNGGEGNTGGTGNTGGEGIVAGSAGDPIAMPCREGRKRCGGPGNNTPQTCDADGAWQDGQACGGLTKVCTGEGVCAAYRLLNAGIDTFGVRTVEPAAEGLPVLKEQTLSAAPRSCGTVKGQQICVTGGIR